MTLEILLEAGPLALLAHPRRSGPIEVWASDHFIAGNRVIVPEIAFYEVRREVVRLRQQVSLERLDQLPAGFPYAPITTRIIVRATELWAQARRSGRPTADPQALDTDVILAATPLELTSQASDVVVATSNVGHLAQFVDARPWQTITP
ncbi:MAG TPA: hypothetical protein VFY90_05465 [Tepidiformaceae bacterium]|nr:hypothetical protein [Tepidiformaceae bacterium]